MELRLKYGGLTDLLQRKKKGKRRVEKRFFIRERVCLDDTRTAE
jgi:hypothetical protein